VVTPHVVTQADLDESKTKMIAGAEPSVADLLLKGEPYDKPMFRDKRGDMRPELSAPALAPPPAAAAAAVPAKPQLRGSIAPIVSASGK